MSDALFNGRSRIPDLYRHRGFQFGDGVFRTCLIYQSQVTDLEGQLIKVLADGKVLGLTPPPVTALRREAKRLAIGRGRGVLKIYLLRAGAGRGYRPATVPEGAADRLMVASEAPLFPASRWRSGVTLGRSGFRLAHQPALAGIKHLNRLEYVLASSKADARWAEALVEDDRGRPLEGTRSNLFWVRRGVLYTPKLDRCGVAGLTRDRILEIARARRISVRLVNGSWRSLRSADEVLVCNSLVGIWPVRRLEEGRWRAPGPVTTKLMEALAYPRLVAA